MKKLVLFILLALFIQLITYSQSCLPDGIVFSSQVEIDNFQTNYPNCTEIEGDVEINGYFITNLNGLNVVTSIGGGLIIYHNVLLASLTGLGNLTSIGGELKITGNNTLTSLTGLDNITSIGGDLSIGNNPSLIALTGLSNITTLEGYLRISSNYNLTSLTGLNNLTSIGGYLEIRFNDVLTSLTGLDNIDAASIDSLFIIDNDSLSTCDVQCICDYLASPNGVVEIYSNAPGCNNPPEIANACGITLSCLPYGNYYLYSQAEIDDFPTDYNNCTEIEGDVVISGINITNLNGLSVVTSIGGRLSIGVNPSLASLTGLDNVTSIGGDLYFGNNEALTSLTGLEGLTSIGGALRIGGYPYGTSLTSISGLNNLTSIGGDLVISFNATLTSIAGLNNLTSIGGSIFIASNSVLNSLTGLENITSIPGSLEIGGDDFYSHHNNLINLSGLDNVTSVGEYISIGYSHFLTSLSGLDNLTSVGGGLSISINNNLVKLTDLMSLTSIGGSLSIYYNNALTSLTGLDNIDAASISTLYIEDNTSLSYCEVQSVCDYLSNPSGVVDIDDNASGCSNREEVEEACETVSVDETGLSDKVIIFPNPSSNQITIELPNTPQKNAVLTINNINGQQLILHKITEQKTVVDITELPTGFLFVQLNGGQEITTQKIVKMR